jgi:hypothetical protein
MKKINLFLDDIRIPSDVSLYVSNPNLKKFYSESEFDIVRSYKEFVDYIIDNGVPDLISFDHDLADEHYDPSMYLGPEVYNKNYDSFKEKTGLDCAKFLIEYCMDNEVELPEYLVHSMNPTGARNILSILDNYSKFNQ